MSFLWSHRETWALQAYCAACAASGAAAVIAAEPSSGHPVQTGASKFALVCVADVWSFHLFSRTDTWPAAPEAPQRLSQSRVPPDPFAGENPQLHDTLSDNYYSSLVAGRTRGRRRRRCRSGHRSRATRPTRPTARTCPSQTATPGRSQTRNEEASQTWGRQRLPWQCWNRRQDALAADADPGSLSNPPYRVGASIQIGIPGAWPGQERNESGLPAAVPPDGVAGCSSDCGKTRLDHLLRVSDTASRRLLPDKRELY